MPLMPVPRDRSKCQCTHTDMEHRSLSMLPVSMWTETAQSIVSSCCNGFDSITMTPEIVPVKLRSANLILDSFTLLLLESSSFKILTTSNYITNVNTCEYQFFFCLLCTSLAIFIYYLLAFPCGSAHVEPLIVNY